MSDVPCFIGIDVAKAQLDIALRPSGERWAVPNETSGVTTLVEQLQARHPTLIVLEATGGLERLVASALATAGLPVVVVNPRQVRDFARATGQLAKTDALDARALAHFADVIRPTPRPLPDAQTQELRALLGRRQQLIGIRTAEQNRLAGTSTRLAKDIDGAYHLDQRTPGYAGQRPRDGAPGQSAVARQRRPLAECPGHWARVFPDVAAGTPGIGDAHAAADRGVGGRRAPQLRQWDPAGPAHHLGRSRACAHRVVHGYPRGDAFQPADQSLLRTAARRGEGQKSRPDGLYAQVFDHTQRHAEASDALATPGGAKLKKYTRPP